MSEDEAKTKMCCGPQVVAMSVLITAPKGEVEIAGDAGRCIGSACMAWRTAQIGRVLDGDEYKTWREEGFCGLAGIPQ